MFVRIEYRKFGPLVFISHLDLIRCWERIVRRADIGVSFTEGFHPRPRFSFSPPLPVGFEGERELLDIKLEKPCLDIKNRINRVVPQGIYVNNIFFIQQSDLGESVIGGLYSFQWLGDTDRVELEKGLEDLGLKDWLYNSEQLTQTSIFHFKNSLTIPLLFEKGYPSPKKIVELVDGIGEVVWLKLSRVQLLER
ncbi:MAG: TIGR03936 family radical SAM-associated protein [bacterium]|nr:TIGR03936 family radical SAM-associated protein [bacterium]